MRSDCEKCSGTGWILKRLPPGQRARAVAERCACVFEQQERQRLGWARIPRKFAQVTLESFRAEEVSLHEAREACRKLVQSWPQAKRGLLLMGPPGLGKTHLAAATLRELLRKGADGLFYDFRDLLEELKASYDDGQRGGSESAILQRVFTADVLVLDEIGSEKLTDWVREVVHRIVIRRYNDERLTLFTTNYLDAELLGEEADPLATLQGRIGARLRSRLYEMCETLVLKGTDFRRQGNQYEKLRSGAAGATAAGAAAETSEEDRTPPGLERWERSLMKLPSHLREPWFEQARKSFQSAMPHKIIHRKAAELYRDAVQAQRDLEQD